MCNEADTIINLIHNTKKYDVVHQNQEGANAYAFKAKHIPLDKYVFLKVYRRPDDDSSIFDEPRLLVEATTGVESNKHIIQVFDAEKLDADWVLYCMEWIDNGSLLKELTTSDICVHRAIEITKGILRGLSAFHRMLFVHRDLKPANILLASEGDRVIPKLGDFGSAVKLKKLGDSVTASKHSALYVPPEGWGEGSIYSAQSDIYQVGIVMAELLCGPLPYSPYEWLDKEAKKEIKSLGYKHFDDLPDCDASLLVDKAIARKAIGQKIITKLTWGSHLNQNLKKIVTKATHPELSQRYGSAADMLTALDTVTCPNWYNSREDLVLLAYDWRGWDWKILTRPKGGFEIKRSQVGKNSWRRWGATFLSISNAVGVISKHQ